MAPTDVLPVAPSTTTLAGLAQALEAHERNQSNLDLPLAKLRVTPTNAIVVPGVGAMVPTEWAWGQFQRVLGFSDHYFLGLDPAERSAELNMHLGRTKRVVRLQVAHGAGHPVGGEACGSVRAILSTSYSPLAASLVARVLAEVIGSEAPVLRTACTDRSTSWVVRAGGPIRPGNRASIVGDVFGVVLMRTSDVGYSSLYGLIGLHRVVCSNSMALPVGRSTIINRRHVGLGLREVRGVFRERLRGLPGRFEQGARALESVMEAEVQDPEAEARHALQDGHLPLRFVPPVLAAFQLEPHLNAWGIAMAITRAAQTATPEEQLQLEWAASQYVRQVLSGSR